MPKFSHGYALLIGVGDSAYPKWSLPVTVKDVQALRAILTNVDLCAYPDSDEHICLLHDAGATRSAILDAMAWLKAQASADEEATVVIYYSGHGWLEQATDQYYLLPHDVEPFDIPGTALSARAFTQALREIPAQRLLVFVDSCHAEGIATAKDAAAKNTAFEDELLVKLPPGFAQIPLPKGLVDELKQGEGRAVLTSSRGKQLSWIRPDGTQSIYTYHLLEALQGAGNQPGDTIVRVSNLMNYLGKAVPESARQLWQVEQTPFFDTAAEDFPVAVLHGGKGLPVGGWEAVQDRAAETIRHIYWASTSGSGGLAQGPGAAAAGESGTAIGTIHGNVYFGPSPQDHAEALTIYRQVVAQSSGQLPLRGVDMGAVDPTTGQKPINLANVYIDLDTTLQVPLTEAEKEKSDSKATPLSSSWKLSFTESLLAEAEEEAGREWPPPGEQGGMRPRSALEVAIAHRRLVLLGNPGGGKSTFINYMGHCLATYALQPHTSYLDYLPGWPRAEAEALPLIIILRDFARSLPAQLPRPVGPSHLWNFIIERLKAQNLDMAREPICRALEKGQALVLLDGLDEISSMAERVFVRDAVIAFVERYPSNRYVVTCRVLSYQPSVTRETLDLQRAGFSEFELAPFDEQKVDRFIVAWYDEVARLGIVSSQDAGGLARQLQVAVRQPDLWRLAPNPLLLTVMALVHTHKGRLPDACATLYEDTVDILLWRWEQIKAGSQEEIPPLRRLLEEANRTDVDLKRTLWQLAYEALTVR